MGLPQGGRRCLGNSNCGLSDSPYLQLQYRKCHREYWNQIGVEIPSAITLELWWQIINEFPHLPNTTGNLNCDGDHQQMCRMEY